MAYNLKTPPSATESFCRGEIDRMLKYSQTKVIMPVVTLGMLKAFLQKGQTVFRDPEIKKTYEAAVKQLKEFLGHDVHIGAKYYDAYGSRMPRYSVLKAVGHLKYKLLPPYTTFAASICEWIPPRIKSHIEERLGVVPLLSNPAARIAYAEDRQRFLELIRQQIGKTLVEIPGVLDAVPRDAEDNAILECAQAGQARFVITGDDDLLTLGSFQGIEILSAAEFQRRWQAGMIVQ